MEVNLSLLIAIAVSGVSVVLTLLFLFVSRRQVKQLNQTLTQQQQQLSALKKQLHITNSTLEEIQARSLVVAKNTEQTEAAITSLQQQLTALGEQEPESKVYQQAASMLQSGASIEEVVHSCDLPEAEVQLLYKIHHSHS